MQVIEVNASFISMMVSCFAVVACILVGVLYGIHSRKQLEALKRRHEIKLKSAHGMVDYEIKKAEKRGYESGFEVGYQQALADIKTGKVAIKNNDKTT